MVGTPRADRGGAGFSSGLWGAGDKGVAETSLWEEGWADGGLEKEAARGLPSDNEESSRGSKGTAPREPCTAAWLSSTCKEQPAGDRQAVQTRHPDADR